MLGSPFRPSGQAHWLFPKLAINDWTIVGCVSTEERCVAIGEVIRPGVGLAHAHFLEIADPPSVYSATAAAMRERSRNTLQRIYGASADFYNFDLNGSPIPLKRLIKDIGNNSSGNIVVDITAMPKRFFFPVLKILSQAANLQNLVVTYGLPSSYHPGELAFEPQDWSFLPMFQREEAPPAGKCEHIVIGVGFLPFGLPDLLKHDYQGVDVSLILPFPPGPPQYLRSWQFIHQIEKTAPLSSDQQILRVSAYEVSRCFDHFINLTGNGTRRTVFAPYGPKTHSLAMCLFAIKHNCDVYYTQPRYYHPEYSSGIMRDGGGPPVIHAYSVKMGGRDLY